MDDKSHFSSGMDSEPLRDRDVHGGEPCFDSCVYTFTENRTAGKMLRINDRGLHEETPGSFSMLLPEDSSAQMTHHPSTNTLLGIYCEPPSLQPDFKEETTLHFSFEMAREDDLNGPFEWGEPGSPEISRPQEFARRCKSSSSSSDEVIHAEKMETTLASKDHFCHFGAWDYSIRSVMFQKTLDLGRKEISLCDRNSAKITIFHYNVSSQFLRISAGGFEGVLVVLNCTDTSNYLKCRRAEEKAVLTVEAWDRTKLSNFTLNDPDTLPFLFFMLSKASGIRSFQSANCNGWFIRATKWNEVQMDCKMPHDESVCFTTKIL